MYTFIRDTIAKFDACYERRGDDECWEWLRGKQTNGYGVFYVSTRSFLAHRFALELKMREPIPDGLFALHSCDNPSCVNPAHLRVGTSAENTKDALVRDRLSAPPRNHRPGSASHFSVLTEDEVKSLLWDRIAGNSLNALSDKYGIGPAAISSLVNGRTWKHVFGANGFPTLAQVQNAPPAPRGRLSRQLAAERRG
jgi:hypothetical protein